LTFKGEKVSKSKGGLYTISELEEKGFSPLEYRYLCLTTHYRKPLNFTLENLESARNSYQRLKNIISEIKDDKKINEVYLKKFEKDINYDLNMPNALAELWDFIRDKKAKGKYQTIKNMDEVFGLDLLKKEKVEISKKVKELIKEREKARKEKDWKKADELRDKIKKQGYSLDDTKKGAVVKKDG